LFEGILRRLKIIVLKVTRCVGRGSDRLCCIGRMMRESSNMNGLLSLHKELTQYASPAKAALLARFFKTGKGEYAEGDAFLGVVVPDVRRIAKHYRDLPLQEVSQLLNSGWHEERMTALFILIDQYQRGSVKKQNAIYSLYIKNTEYINNWDLIDLTAGHIVGAHIANGHAKEATLFKFAQSKSLWERRIAMLATFYCTKNGDARLALAIAELLVHDTHDLIHKAVGWMLREVGKRCSLKEEEGFLDKYAATMPRTMLRYAIERFEPKKREYYMRMKTKQTI
ncbi:MAG: hypothetical protein ACD_81C00227G0001, partial [uncultured bacterium]